MNPFELMRFTLPHYFDKVVELCAPGGGNYELDIPATWRMYLKGQIPHFGPNDPKHAAEVRADVIASFDEYASKSDKYALCGAGGDVWVVRQNGINLECSEYTNHTTGIGSNMYLFVGPKKERVRCHVTARSDAEIRGIMFVERFDCGVGIAELSDFIDQFKA